MTAHGVVLFLVLVFLRMGKVAFARVDPGALDQLALILPEVGFVLLFESFWWLIGRGRSGRLWYALFLLAHLAVYAFVVVNHGFFVNTGYRVDFDLAIYTLTHLGTVGSIITQSVNVGFWIQVVTILTGMLLAGRLARLLERRLERPAPPHPLIKASLPLVGLVLVAWLPASSAYLRDLSRNDVIAFGASTVYSAMPREETLPRMIAPEEFHQDPRLLSTEVTRRPNIVLVILESTGAQATGVDFSKGGLSPNLAAIAERSLVFDSVYSTVTHTSKTLVGILCGMVGRVDLKITEAARGYLHLTCLPHLLGELGYRTAFLQTARGSFENRPGLVGNLGYQHGAYQETMLREPFQKTGYLGMDEFAMLEPAVGWAAAGDDPFFLTVLTVTPHHPYEVPGLESTAPDEVKYLDTLRHQDAFVGALYDGLERTGSLDDTLVIILGDHGEAFGEHRLYEHDAVSYEEVVWTPMIISGPEWLGEPRRIGGLRSHLDILPTILEILGAQWEGILPGRSLLSTEGHDEVFTACWDRNRCLAMRRGQMKYVHHLRKRATEVYDLASDPTEQVDLAESMNAVELERVESRIRAFKLSVDAFWAQYPLPDDDSASEASE